MISFIKLSIHRIIAKMMNIDQLNSSLAILQSTPPSSLHHCRCCLIHQRILSPPPFRPSSLPPNPSIHPPYSLPPNPSIHSPNSLPPNLSIHPPYNLPPTPSSSPRPRTQYTSHHKPSPPSYQHP